MAQDVPVGEWAGNSHGHRYSINAVNIGWQGPNICGSLDMHRTLTENGILKEAHTSIPPAIWLFYNDDFTIA